MNNIFYFYLNSFILSQFDYKHQKLVDLEFENYPWFNYDKSFYNHVILVEEITAYDEWFSRLSDTYNFCKDSSYQEYSHCKQEFLYCATQYRIKDLYKIEHYCKNYLKGPNCIYFDIIKINLLTFRLVRNKRTLGYKTDSSILDLYDLRSPYVDRPSYKNLVFIKHQQPDIYYYDLSKQLKSLFFPLIPQIPNHKLHSKYILIGFNKKILLIMKKFKLITDYCKDRLTYNDKDGIKVKNCTLIVDHKCLIKEALYDLNYKSKNDIKQNYLYCIKIELIDRLNDEYFHNHNCDSSIKYNSIAEKSVIEGLTGSQFQYKNKETDFIFDLISNFLQFGTEFIPYVDEFFAIIMFIKDNIDIFSNHLIDFDQKTKNYIESIKLKISQPYLYKNINDKTNTDSIRNLPHYDEIELPSRRVGTIKWDKEIKMFVPDVRIESYY